jgi:chromosome segregation ATPase
MFLFRLLQIVSSIVWWVFLFDNLDCMQLHTHTHTQDAIGGKIKERDRVRGEVQRESQVFKNKLKELNGRKTKLFEQKKLLQAKIKSAQEARHAREDQIRDAKKALPLKKVSDSLETNLKAIDDEIQ